MLEKEKNVGPQRLLLALDGGGTKTDVSLGVLEENGTARELASVTLGPGNLQTVALELLAESIDVALIDLKRQAGVIDKEISATCFAMAGTSSLLHCQQWRELTETRQWGANAMLTHDAHTLLAARDRTAVGIALISGTGSFAFARTKDGRELRCGGWGYLFGDEGGAYQLALSGFRCAAMAVDGRGSRTSLVERFNDWLGTDPTGWFPKLKMMDREQVGFAAKIVCEQASLGDDVCVDLLQHAAKDLARLVKQLALNGFPGQAIDLVIAGGLISHSEYLREHLVMELEGHNVRIETLTLVSRPVLGALELAASLLN